MRAAIFAQLALLVCGGLVFAARMRPAVRENSDESAFPITLSCYPRQLDTFKIAIFRIDGPISVEPAKPCGSH